MGRGCVCISPLEHAPEDAHSRKWGKAAWQGGGASKGWERAEMSQIDFPDFRSACYGVLLVTLDLDMSIRSKRPVGGRSCEVEVHEGIRCG